MNVFYKIMCFICVLFLNQKELKAQDFVKNYDEASIDPETIKILRQDFGKQKKTIDAYEKQILIALSYFQELKAIHIKFRLKKRRTPLATRPTFFSMFRSAKKRTYIITISGKSTTYLDTITLKNLRFNAQIGVLGHELSHISDYITKGFGKMLALGKNELFYPKLVDQVEYETDLSCINHGLGYQLLDWSINVRDNLNRTNWLGARNLDKNKNIERYMNPETIKAILKKHPLY